MTAQSKTTNKTRFNTGDVPTETHFADLIDSFDTLSAINVADYGAKGDGATDDTAALNSAWTAVAAGGVLKIPPGDYLISDTVSFISKVNVTINGDNAQIITKASSDFTSKALVDLAGSTYATVRGLRIESTLTSNKPAAGLVLGRVGTGDGGGILLEAVWVSGTYTFAAVYDCGSEVDTFLHCRFHTTDGVPCYYTSSTDEASLCVQDTVSNVCKRFYSCTFVNYGSTATNVVELHGVTKEVSLRDCYFGISPTASNMIYLSGTSASTYGLILDNVRVEASNHASTRLIYNDQDNPLTMSTISRIIWTVTSDYVIELHAAGLTYSDIELLGSLPGTTKWIKADQGMAYNRIVGTGAASIYINTGIIFICNDVTWYSASSPFAGAGSFDYFTRQDNVIRRMTDYDSEISYSKRRRYGSYFDSGTAPSVAGCDLFSGQWGTPTTVANFTGAVPGQTVTIITTNGDVTIAHNTTIKLSGSTSWNMPAGASLTLTYFDYANAWYEVSRMVP
jgi:hypothetical protein